MACSSEPFRYREVGGLRDLARMVCVGTLQPSNSTHLFHVAFQAIDANDLRAELDFPISLVWKWATIESMTSTIHWQTGKVRLKQFHNTTIRIRGTRVLLQGLRRQRIPLVNTTLVIFARFSTIGHIVPKIITAKAILCCLQRKVLIKASEAKCFAVVVKHSITQTLCTGDTNDSRIP